MNNLYRKGLKRFFDICVALFGLIIVSPVIVVVSILVYFKLGSPILFKQKRPGKGGRIFSMYKYRTMSNARDEHGDLLPDSQRLTKFGKILRSSSLDELPGLINVLNGDMSLVGPRPLSIHYLPYYNSFEQRRHNVRPGLTGLSQISGRNNLPWKERFKLDVEYASDYSLSLDLRILLQTMKKVFLKDGVQVRGTTKVSSFNVERTIEIEVNNMTTNEIGSHFWLEYKNETNENSNQNIFDIKKSTNYLYTFSGRSAISLALKDIMQNQNIKSVYMPDYSCISMIQPFLDLNIEIEYYSVKYVEGRLKYSVDKTKNPDIFFSMNYFGFDNSENEYWIDYMKNKGSIIVEDITHCLFNEYVYSESSDYVVASLRKWLPVPSGGLLYKQSGELKYTPNENSNSAVEKKLQAMQLKREFIEGVEVDKEEYLRLFAEFENNLIRFKDNLKIDDISKSIIENYDYHLQKSIRRRNAQFIYDNLKSNEIKFLFPKPDFNETTPIFVPILLETEKRDSLRKWLISNNVYLPVHWSEIMGNNCEIKSRELSIVCDQRYGIKDMKRIVDLIEEWENRL